MGAKHRDPWGGSQAKRYHSHDQVPVLPPLPLGYFRCIHGRHLDSPIEYTDVVMAGRKLRSAEGVRSWEGRYARQLEKPRALLPPVVPHEGGLWADLGCGGGIFTKVLRDLLDTDASVLAIDKNARVLGQTAGAVAHWGANPRVEVIQSDFRDPLPVKHLNGALLANALHFIPKPDQRDVLLGVLDALRPGGRLVLVEYNTERRTSAVPYPISANAFRQLARDLPLMAPRVAARTSSSYLGEMYAGVGFRG